LRESHVLGDTFKPLMGDEEYGEFIKAFHYRHGI
jgi:hypothetical protein